LYNFQPTQLKIQYQRQELILEKAPKTKFYSVPVQGVKIPAENQQVHHQKDASDPCLGGLHCPGSDIVETIAVLTLAKLSFNGNAFQSILSPLGF